MTETPPTKRQVFVLMPFDEAFKDIYEGLIKHSFESAEFCVYRADDIQSQQNILRDVVTAINAADVIIADLTDSNPNVYYELGLAHALRKPVILLTDDIGSIPFDLRSYRVIEYNTHFAHIQEARKQLKEVASKIAAAEMAFGNPISDFLPQATSLITESQPPALQKSESDDTGVDEPGFLDGVVEVVEGFEELTKIVGQVSEQVAEIGNLVVAATPELEEAGKRQDVRRARNILRSLGTKYQGHATELQTLNFKFRDSLPHTSNALEVVLGHISQTGQAENPDEREFLSSIDSMETESRGTKEAIVGLIQTMDAMPRMERTFDKSRKRIARELDQFADNLDQIISMTIRVRSIISENNGDLPK